MKTTTSVLASILTMTLGGVAIAQDQPASSSSASQGAQPHQPTAPSAASSPHQRDVTSQSQTEAVPTPGAAPTAASSPHQREVTGKTNELQEGMAVQDRSGHALGSVSKVIEPTASSHGYVVIARPDGKTTTMPSTVASSKASKGRLVVDSKALKGAPTVRLSELETPDSGWQAKSDHYWSR
jgi:hypothetical protein